MWHAMKTEFRREAVADAMLSKWEGLNRDRERALCERPERASIFDRPASVWTNDLSTAHRLARIKAGTVGVNCHNFVDPNMPFRRVQQSGFGSEHGRVAVEMYTKQKSVCILI